MKILVLNSGSSSIKYKVFQMPAEKLLAKGSIERIGEQGSQFKDHYSGLKTILFKHDQFDVVGHRVVHGAEEFREPVIIDKQVIKKIKQSCVLAPLHNPANLTGILACKKLLPKAKQVAVFDTAFHQTLPDYAYIYGLPYEYYRRYGIRKYGFHGTSHEYIMKEAAKILKKPKNKLKIISCHLGNGCSIAAIDRGRSIDTSMGFTPLEGLVMGTRCGDIDPALVTYIMSKKNFDISSIENVLNKFSGLKGISGISNDMRIIDQKRARGNRRARLALEVFVYRIKKYIGAYTAIMGGCHAVVFTAGIGENQGNVRKMICNNLFSYLKKKPKILVVPADEELMIARHSFEVIRRR